jgi:ribonuclease III
LANMPKPTYKDRQDLEDKEAALQDMRTDSRLKRDCTVVISSEVDSFF